MPRDMMTQCEQKTEFRRPGGDVWEWKVVPVTRVLEVPRERLRCMHCHGAVRVHRRQVEHGPQDHVEHLLRQDSEHCPGGVHYTGQFQFSSQPVE